MTDDDDIRPISPRDQDINRQIANAEDALAEAQERLRMTSDPARRAKLKREAETARRAIAALVKLP